MLNKDKFEELSNLTHLVTSDAWKSYVKILEEHKAFLQKTVNENVREQNLIEAYGALMRLYDIDKIFSLIDKRLKDLERERK